MRAATENARCDAVLAAGTPRRELATQLSLGHTRLVLPVGWPSVTGNVGIKIHGAHKLVLGRNIKITSHWYSVAKPKIGR